MKIIYLLSLFQSWSNTPFKWMKLHYIHQSSQGMKSIQPLRWACLRAIPQCWIQQQSERSGGPVSNDQVWFQCAVTKMRNKRTHALQLLGSFLLDHWTEISTFQPFSLSVPNRGMNVGKPNTTKTLYGLREVATLSWLLIVMNMIQMQSGS